MTAQSLGPLADASIILTRAGCGMVAALSARSASLDSTGCLRFTGTFRDNTKYRCYGKQMNQEKEFMHGAPIVIFVCEHGAAKSIIAAAYFNQLANRRKLNLSAVARGTNPDPLISELTIEGLSKDGLIPTESAPQKLSWEDVKSAQRIVSFCELPIEYKENY
jgi:hypothetical protein